MGVENGKVTYRWTISDTGVGMSEDFLQHIFEPFAQENSDARSVYQGTGLGMAIAKSLADKMGGDIRVTSEKGKGSVFVVTLAFGNCRREAERRDERGGGYRRGCACCWRRTMS